jgi:hypothetical protein
MPCKSGSPHGVIGTAAEAAAGGVGAWAAVGLIGPEKTAPAAATAANIEPENLSRMIASLCVLPDFHIGVEDSAECATHENPIQRPPQATPAHSTSDITAADRATEVRSEAAFVRVT